MGQALDDSSAGWGLYAEPEYLDHLLGGIQWAMGLESGDSGRRLYLPRLETRTIH